MFFGSRALGLALLVVAAPGAFSQAMSALPPGTVASSASSPSASSASAALLAAPPSVTVGQIVDRLVEHNAQRQQALRGYTEERHYAVAYHGFPALHASMTVEAIFDAPSNKRFVILSQSGSGLLVDHVLKRLLTSEQEAARNPGPSDLTPANYNFTLLGQQTVDGHPVWVLYADPKGESKFLFRGKIYVDAADYAVIRIDAEPAKNPSFWIRETHIHHQYAKTGDFWLPEENVSETSVRLGGTAVLTIDYGKYQLTPSVAAEGPAPAKPETTGIASR